MGSNRLNLLAAVLTAVTSISAYGQTASEHAHTKAPASTELKIIVGGKSTTLTLAELAAMPQKTVTVHNDTRGLMRFMQVLHSVSFWQRTASL